MTRILVVDDSATIRKMVRASLRELGQAEFAEAASGLEAIEQLAIWRVSLLVLDLNMPDMHGIDVLRFVRQQPSLRRLPVIVLTTRGDDSSRIAAQQAGATAYVTKPFMPGTLAEIVRGLLVGTSDALESQ
jgi:two-component system, chemotaxis family, chemotaxis protein CheY